MTRKQIDQSREIRLWIGQVIVPAAAAVVTVAAIPEARDFVKDKFGKVKQFVAKKFLKKEEA